MNPFRHAFRLAAMYAIAAATTAHALSARADGRLRVPDDPAYRQECGACHVAYPPQLLSAASWRAVMGGLDRHFGTDASLEPAARASLLALLERHAGRRDTTAGGQPQLRITETAWFRKEHREELPADILRRPEVKSFANCGACHTGAEKGDYSEASLRVPGGRRR
ncbi:MAG: cytochrome C [Burkholderiales bacterium]